jgi:hypothetical protein
MEGWVRSHKTIRATLKPAPNYLRLTCKAMNSRIRRLPLGRPPRLRHSRQSRLKASTVDKLRIGSRAHLSSAILRSCAIGPRLPVSQMVWRLFFLAACNVLNA